MSRTTLFDSRIKKYAYRESAQIYKEIGASPDGLSREQVEEMREQYGANSFAERKNDTMVCRLRRAFINPFNVPLDKNPEIFFNTVAHNRVIMLVASTLFIIFGLNNTRNREKFI